MEAKKAIWEAKSAGIGSASCSKNEVRGIAWRIRLRLRGVKQEPITISHAFSILSGCGGFKWLRQFTDPKIFVNRKKIDGVVGTVLHVLA